MPEAAGSIVSGAHGPQVSSSQTTGPASPLISGKSANDYAFMTREMERDRKLYDSEWQRRIKAEKSLYATMLKSQKGLNQNISGIATDSKAFWARTSAELSRTLKNMTLSFSKEMSEVSTTMENQMDKMISLSMQRQKKADEALRAAVKQGDLYSYQMASYKAKNESNRLSHATTYKRKTIELSEASRAKSVYETKMSQGEKLTPEDYRAYERLTSEIRDLEREMQKLNLVNKFMAKGISDVEQAMRAADIELDNAAKKYKSLDQRISEWKVNALESAHSTLTFANALSHLGEAVKLLYKDYTLFVDQAYKMNGVIDMNNLSFTQLAKNTVHLEVSNAKLRLFAATAGISTEEFDQLNGKLFNTYTMMDKFGKMDTRKYETMGKELLSYSRQTGASLDQTIGIHAKLRMQFGKTNTEALRSMHSIIAAQKETQAATADAFGDFATYQDDFQKSIESVIDGYSGFKLDVAGVTALFGEQVVVAKKLGYTYQQSFDIAKKFTGLLTKKNSSYMSYHTGNMLIEQAGSLFGGQDKIKALENLSPDKRAAYIDKVLGTAQGKASGFKQSDINDMMLALNHPTKGGPAAVHVANMMEGSTALIAAKLQKLDQMQKQGMGSSAAFSAVMGEENGDDALREYGLMQDMLKDKGQKSFAQMAKEIQDKNNKNGNGQTPANAPTWTDPFGVIAHFKDFWDKSPLGQMAKGTALLIAASVANTAALGLNTLALLGNAGGKVAGVFGSILRKVPGVGRILGPKMPAAMAEGAEGAALGAGTKGAGLLGKFASVSRKIPMPGKIAAALALTAAGIYGVTKLLDHASDKTKDQQDESDTKDLLGNTGDQVEEQKKTNDKLDKLNSLVAKSGSVSGSGGLLSTIGTVAAGATGVAGGLAAYFGIKGLLSGSADAADAADATKAAAAVTEESATKGAEKAAVSATEKTAAHGAGAFLSKANLLLDPLLAYYNTEGPEGRKVAAAGGAALGGTASTVAGAFSLNPMVAFGLGVGGSMAGQSLFTYGYDKLFADKTLIKGHAPSLGQSPTDFDANTVAGAVGSPEGQSFGKSATGGPGGTAGNAPGAPIGVGTGNFSKVGRDGTAELTLKVKVANMHNAVRTVLRDDYNMEHSNSGVSRTHNIGAGIAGS